MLRQYLQGIQGIELFGIIAMVLFVAFFTVVVVYTLRMKKEEESGFSRIPFEESRHSVNPYQD